MRLSKEQIIKDDERWAKRDIMEELRWCSVEVGDRVHITNDDLHFFAFVARKAYELLKEKQPKKGHWKENDDKNFECSECGNESLSFDDVYVYGMKLENFCPNCGADMRKDGDGE